jgi:hypothetical protein
VKFKDGIEVVAKSAAEPKNRRLTVQAVTKNGR